MRPKHRFATHVDADTTVPRDPGSIPGASIFVPFCRSPSPTEMARQNPGFPRGFAFPGPARLPPWLCRSDLRKDRQQPKWRGTKRPQVATFQCQKQSGLFDRTGNTDGLVGINGFNCDPIRLWIDTSVFQYCKQSFDFSFTFDRFELVESPE